ncbi:MAG TPA: hypothetical protein VNZ05_04770 [Solirubrobacteraceae bacterium]|jgi:hypothetical protein|nr:hypothetical protein [Solirubrobacteraceae bacterium]
MAALPRQPALKAFAAGAVPIAVVLAIAASGSAWQRVGSDNTAVQLTIGTLPAGAVGCQPHEPLAAGTGAVRIAAVPASPGSVALRVQLRAAGRLEGAGAPGGVAPGGTVVAALAHRTASAIVAPLCVWNTGQATLALQGAATGPADRLTVALAGKPAGAMVGRVRVDDLTGSHPSSLWSVLGKLPERAATATGSALAPWLAAVGLLGMLLAVAALLWSPGEANERSSEGAAPLASAGDADAR